MSTDKGESDLDVFNDLKPQTPDGLPITETKKTLMGLQAPEEGDAPSSNPLPPVPGFSLSSLPSHVPPLPGGLAGSGGGSSRSVPPPPPSQRPKRASAAPPLPPPSRPNATFGSNIFPSGAASSAAVASTALNAVARSAASNADLTPVTPASVPMPAGARPDDDERGEDTNPGAPPESAPDEPKSGGRFGLDSWTTTNPSLVSSPRISVVPSPPVAPLAESLAAAAAPAAAGAAQEVGWDDDDDKTTIYDKDTQAAAQSLLQPVPPGLSGRPPPPMSRPPGAIMPPGMVPPGNPFATRSTAPPIQDASYAMPIQPPPGQRVLPYLLALVGAVLFGALIWAILPKKGSLTVTVAGGIGNKAPAAVEILVDGKVRCRESPCEISSLKAGTHYVEVKAPGYQATAKSAVAIVGDQTAVHNVQLIRAGTGIKVFGEGTGLTLLVDGNEFGPLPQELREMEPGEHVIQVAGGPRYEVFQQRIMVDPDRMTPIGPVKLKVTKGLATIRAGANAEDAEVTLRVGDSRRVLPALPVRLEVETDKPHVLIARKRGFATFEQPITFEDGQAEKTIEIVLSERPAEDPVRRRAPGPNLGQPSRTDGVEPGAEAAPAAEEEAPAPEPSAKATLNLTSTPPSNVLLDGKPLGTTPLRDIQVEPGQHRVIFIHGAERKPKSVDVAPGSKQTVSVSF